MVEKHAPADPVQFVLAEGRLLNEARYAEWIELFAQDGVYWVPLAGDRQPDPQTQTSIAYEDRLLLATRIRRLQSPRAHSLEPGVRGLHVLQAPQLDERSEAEASLTTPFLYLEARGERQMLLGGTWRHRLRWTEAGWRIVRKRVDLVNAGTAHEAIQLFP